MANVPHRSGNIPSTLASCIRDASAGDGSHANAQAARYPIEHNCKHERFPCEEEERGNRATWNR
jgi:hypothetical protein